jgi:16S rRNA processing protein RimM
MVDTIHEPLVRIAVVATAHGVRGALRLHCFTERPESVAAYGPLYDQAGRRLFEIEVIGAAKGGVIVRAPGIADRAAALRLRGLALYVPRSALPAPGEDEFYREDLVGLLAETTAGRRLGRVRAVLDFGAGDMLEIEAEDGRTEVLPFTRAVVPVVDVKGGRIVVEPPAEVVVEPHAEAEA